MTPEQLKKQLDWHAGREDSFFNHDRDMFKAIRRVVNEYLKLSATDEDEVRRRNVEGPRGMLRYPTTGATDAGQYPTEAIADNGDVWHVRPCDEDECVVIARYRAKPPRPHDPLLAALDEEVAKITGETNHPEGAPSDDPSEDIHVPADVASTIGRALLSVAGATGATDAEKPLSDAEHATAMLLQDATAPPPGTPAEPAPLQILERAVERKTGKTIEYLRNTPLDELPASPAPQGAAPLAGLAAKVREIQNPYKNTPPFNYSFVAWQEAIEAAASLVENASANKQSTS
jgi:hypothetical protein